uniref:Uncharacterized protein n=1 Tax=Arundo donax TaxID=35708 RepID=A0A0A8YR17_ARUDO
MQKKRENAFTVLYVCLRLLFVQPIIMRNLFTSYTDMFLTYLFSSNFIVLFPNFEGECSAGWSGAEDFDWVTNYAQGFNA